MTHLNDEISKENPNCMFITIFIGMLNITTGRLTYTNAGHTPTLIKSKEGEIKMLTEVHGPVVGVTEDFAYEEAHIELKAGESILTYTDGVTEAHNTKNEMYSEEKLMEFLKDHPLETSKEFLNDLYKDLRKFEAGREPFDDTTALCLKYIKSLG